MLTDRTGELSLFQHILFLCAVLRLRRQRRADVIATYDTATVLVTVTSQVALRPSLHGLDVNPSGRFQSDLIIPCGSMTDGMTAPVNERQIKSFSADAVFCQDCACKKKLEFHECQHWHRM